MTAKMDRGFDRMIAENMKAAYGAAKWTAQRWDYRRESVPDLAQIGLLGVVEALPLWNGDEQFASFMFNHARKAIGRYVAKETREHRKAHLVPDFHGCKVRGHHHHAHTILDTLALREQVTETLARWGKEKGMGRTPVAIADACAVLGVDVPRKPAPPPVYNHPLRPRPKRGPLQRPRRDPRDEGVTYVAWSAS